MGQACNENADFSGLFAESGETLAISQVVQKTFLEINE